MGRESDASEAESCGQQMPEAHDSKKVLKPLRRRVTMLEKELKEALAGKKDDASEAESRGLQTQESLVLYQAFFAQAPQRRRPGESDAGASDEVPARFEPAAPWPAYQVERLRLHGGNLAPRASGAAASEPGPPDPVVEAMQAPPMGSLSALQRARNRSRTTALAGLQRPWHWSLA
eukprot:NODE_3731_length_749_cov_251.873199.p1 GENE.NODE_3731_length_749_cov_251.873199~~NODE_3731_length_749_cov_251.873199.p1  ORF type:complete len:176 (-),score=33.18 NODE_3731_length_749_cov_251.873199:204-731(-)